MIRYLHLLILVLICLSISRSYSQGMSPNDSIEFKKAVAYYDNQDFENAYKILAGLINSGLSYPELYYYIGLIYHDTNNVNQAKKYYELAIKQDSTYANPYSDLAALLISEGKFEDATKSASKAIKHDSSFVKGYLNLGAAYMRMGNSELAGETFYEAAVIDPDEVANIGTTLLMQQNNPKAANYYYSIVLSAYPDHLLTLLNMANSYRLLGNYEEAKKCLEHGYNVGSLSTEVYGVLYSTYFRLLFDLGEYKTVLNKSFERVGKNYLDAHFFNAIAYYKTNQEQKFRQSALEYFRLSKIEVPRSLSEWAESKIGSTKY